MQSFKKISLASFGGGISVRYVVVEKCSSLNVLRMKQRRPISVVISGLGVRGVRERMGGLASQ